MPFLWFLFNALCEDQLLNLLFLNYFLKLCHRLLRGVLALLGGREVRLGVQLLEALLARSHLCRFIVLFIFLWHSAMLLISAAMLNYFLLGVRTNCCRPFLEHAGCECTIFIVTRRSSSVPRSGAALLGPGWLHPLLRRQPFLRRLPRPATAAVIRMSWLEGASVAPIVVTIGPGRLRRAALSGVEHQLRHFIFLF